MPKPSLLIKGNLVVDKYIKQAVPRPENILPLDYIMNFISDRIPSKKHGKPNTKATAYGDKLILIKAGTASGKSTTIPTTLFLRFFDRLGKSICVSQPRVLNAVSIPQDIISIPGFEEFKLEKNIGFLTGDFKRPPTEKGLTFMTVGVLLNQLINMTPDEICRRYSFIILDEIHERSADMDTLLFLVKKFLQEAWKNDDCPLVIAMSATFEPNLFFQYFNCPKHNFIEVKGISHPIKSHFPQFNIMNIKNYMVDKAIELHEKNTHDLNESIRDIIIFVHSGKLGKAVLDDLHKYNAKLWQDHKTNFIAPIQLTRDVNKIGSKEYMDTFSHIEIIRTEISMCETSISSTKPQKPIFVAPVRRIIVSSTIAEVGLTIETLKYCIDAGYYNSAEFNPEFAVSMLLEKNITRGMALQRKGRVGRKAPGEWFPCYTEETFNYLPIDQFSEMLTQDVAQRILNILCKESEVMIDEYTACKAGISASYTTSSSNKAKKLQETKEDTFHIHQLYDTKLYILKHQKDINFSQIDFFETPGATSLEFMLEKLHVLGMIDQNYKPTIFGYYANKFQKVPLESIRMILSGYAYGANILDLITIAAFTGVEYRNIFKKKYILRNPTKARLDEEILLHARILFGDEFIDSIFVWNEFMNIIELMNKAIAKKGFLDTKRLGKQKTRLTTVEEWCNQNEILYDGILAAALLRDEIITTMIKIGLNPFYNGLELERGRYNLTKIIQNNVANGIQEIIKIKKCILDGFRFNILELHETERSGGVYKRLYKTCPVIVKSVLIKPIMEQQKKPKYIVAFTIRLLQGFSKTKDFEFKAESPISILDGFVDVDKNFLWN